MLHQPRERFIEFPGSGSRHRLLAGNPGCLRGELTRLRPRADSDRFARQPWATKSQKAARRPRIIAEEERLYGQVQARVAMGEEDDERPQVGARRSRRRPALAARSDRRGARRGSAAARRADDAARGAQGAARRRQAAAGRHHVAVLRAHAAASESGKSRDVMVGKRGFIDRAVATCRSSTGATRRSRASTTATKKATTTRRRSPGGASRASSRRAATSRSRGQPAPHRHAAGHVPQGRARRVGRGGRPDRAGAPRRHGQGRAPGRGAGARRASSASTTASRAPTRRCPRSPR